MTMKVDQTANPDWARCRRSAHTRQIETANAAQGAERVLTGLILSKVVTCQSLSPMLKGGCRFLHRRSRLIVSARRSQA